MSEDEQIKELLKRHQDLQNQKAIAEDRLGTARINLQKAKEDAREKYGTDDPGKLGDFVFIFRSGFIELG